MTLLSVFANSYAADGALTSWDSPANVYADDGIAASKQALVKNAVCGNLYGFDLSSLPDTATINSVTIEAEWMNVPADTSGPRFQLGAQHNNTLIGSITDTTGQASYEIATYQPTGLTAAQLKSTGNSGFWAVMRFSRTDNTSHTAYVDYVKITIDYAAGGLAEIMGAADITLGGMTQAVTGAVTVSGTGAVMLDGLTATITGTVQEQGAITGELATTFEGLSASTTGAVVVSGASNTTFDGLSASASGAVNVTGQASNTFSNLSISSTGLVGVAGGISRTLDGITGEIIGVVGNAPVVGLLDATFAGLTCQMVGAVRVSGAVSLVMDGMSAWITAWTEDLYSLQPGSKRRVKVPRPEPARVVASAAARSKRQESFNVEGD